MLCHQPLNLTQHGFCSNCTGLFSSPPNCQQCGEILTTPSIKCGQCLQHPPLWNTLIQVMPYQSPISELIHHFKFQRGFYLDKALARLLLLSILNARRKQYTLLPNLIISVPLHHRRHWQRGYNQAALLAKQLAYWLKIEWSDHIIQRIRPTATQRELNAVARRKNLHRAFILNQHSAKSLKGKRIAIVDDVVTTGATIHNMCTLLKQAGVSDIQIWCLARRTLR